MNLFRYILSDWKKTKHTPIRVLFLSIPIVYSLFIVWYFSTFKLSSTLQSKIYETFFIFMSIVLPILISLICGLIGIQEESAGNFHVLLGSNQSRIKTFTSKLILLIVMTSFSIYFSTILLFIGLKSFIHMEYIQYLVFLQGASWLILSSIILYIIHLMLSFAYGIGASISVGGAGLLISAILGGSIIGDKVWYFIPWTWSIRFSQLTSLFINDIKLPRFMTPSEIFIREVSKSLPYLITFTVIMLIVALLWFNRWEGRKSYE